MKNAEYWKQRFDIIEAAKNRAGEHTITEVEEMFRIAQRELESQIQTWYGRFANNNRISLAEAKRFLKTKELDEFKWDIKQYIKYGEQAGMNSVWMKQLENASARFHVSRLEALQLQTQHTMEKLFGNQLDVVDRLMKQQYLDGYYHTMYEVQKGFNIGWDIAAVNDKRLESIISKPWTLDGKTFSDRIWDDKTKLLNQTHTELTRNMILGKSPDAAINNLAKAMGTSKYNAGRLIMTESAYFSNAAEKAAYNELDVERFEVVETLDSDTCAVCGAMDGKVFLMSDFQAGVTAPPFHPWCRGCTVPRFDDDIGERAAKDADGNTYYVPSDMKFEEWKASYVDKTQPPRTTSNVKVADDLKKDDKDDTIKITVNPDSEIYKKLGEQHYNELHAIVNVAPALERDVWAKMESELKVVSATSKVHPNCKGIKGIEMNVANSAKGSTWSKPHQMTFHEFGHNIDYIANVKYGNGDSFQPFSFTYKNGAFPESIKKETAKKVDEIAKQMKTEFSAHKDDLDWLMDKGYIGQWKYDFYKEQGIWVGGAPEFSKQMAYKALEKELKALKPVEKADISDILEGATGGKISIGFGHGKSYWKRETALGTEAFAEMFDSAIAAPESLTVIKKYLPESYKIFQEILEAILKE